MSIYSHQAEARGTGEQSVLGCKSILFTSTVTGVDSGLAVLLRLQVVTVKRVRAAIFVSWLIFSVVLYSAWYTKLYYILCGVIVPAEVVILTHCYIMIFCTIRSQEAQEQDALATGQKDNFQFTVDSPPFSIISASCYFPFLVLTVVVTIRGLSTSFYLPLG